MASEERLAALAERGVGGDAHHPLFPPSASSRWLNCTASPLPLSHGYEGDDTNVFSAEGSFAHAVFAAMMLNTQSSVANPLRPYNLGQEYEQDSFKFTLDREMVDHLEWARDIVLGLGSGMMLVEQRVGFSAGFIHEVPRTRIEGTADVLVQPDARPHELHVLDLKYGKGVRVEAEENSQMMLYALGSLATHCPMLFDAVTEVHVHVLQPRLDHHDTWSLSVAQLLLWAREKVEPAVTEVLDGTGEFRPTDEGCRWCPIGRAGDCKAQVDHVLADFEDIGEDDEGKDSPATEAALLSVDDLGMLALRARWLEKVAKAMYERIERLQLAGEGVPGWKLVLGRKPAREWASEEPADAGIAEALQLAFGAEGLDPFVAPKLKTPSAIEKEVGKKELAAHPTIVASIKQGDARPTSVPETDRRAAWVPEDDSELDEEFDELLS